ncbi:BTB/POZ domain-containing protein 3-like [Haliotis rubra]|uniref:BTB/POZ domain-containing protein 3-like n=1 Tax=Haliotis rubra TaxID=36100 RepID=UPI001EE5F02B|nr:BTB/POZ domain-containing protein 3-like [Haliotis rubra]XP_046566582.1 BTB/POZ domain-containing protein 3-like [Haliotis rubra]
MSVKKDKNLGMWTTGRQGRQLNSAIFACSKQKTSVTSPSGWGHSNRWSELTAICSCQSQLCVRCDVPWPNGGKKEVTIPDIEADIFKEFLRYIYTDEARINAETVTGLMYTSRKYSLDALYDLCVTFLDKSLSQDNVCQILEECHGYGELDLEQKALKILTEGGKRVTKSPGFVDL